MSENKKYKVLIISTNPPSYSGNLGGDLYLALTSVGCDVDYLSRFPADGEKHANYKYLEPRVTLKSIIKFLRNCAEKVGCGTIFSRFIDSLRKIYYKIKPYRNNFIASTNDSGINIHYIDERKPFFKTSKILKAINKNYDFIVTMYWHKFINSTTLKELYNKLRIPILICGIDMAHITGGCQYFNNCRNFENECGNCPGLNSNNPDDQSHLNFLCKKNNYQSIKCAFIGNTWINNFAIKSKLFQDNKIVNISCIVDEDIYKPANRNEIVKKNDIHQNIILLIRSSQEIRKGGKFAIEALRRLKSELPKNIIDGIIVLTIGDETLSKQLKALNIQNKNLGFVNQEQLIELYQLSTYYLSPSIDDAGPSMVNQSMMCGTPVICFNNGTAIDVIQNNFDGFKTDDITFDGYCSILKKAILTANSIEYKKMCQNARESAMIHNSKKAVGTKFICAYLSIL